jgi:zinc/manganese transport system permease protein
VHWIIEPGFFSSPQVRTALVVGGVSAVVSAVVGVFVVVRGQSFAGHALTESSATGGSGAFLIGVNPLLGFVTGAVVGAGTMEAVGVRHVRGRDLATGIVLGASIGLASLFLYLTTSTSATTGATQQVLFGSIFATAPSTVPIVSVFSIVSLGIVAVAYRPLLLASVDSDLAAARGVRVRLVGIAFMMAMAVAVGLSSIAVGAILSTALLVGPAATALQLTRRMSAALLAACGLGVGATWIGVLLAYDSADWGSGHDALPVSFFIVAVVFGTYLAGAAIGRRTADRRGPAPARAGLSATSGVDRMAPSGVGAVAGESKEASCSRGT